MNIKVAGSKEMKKTWYVAENLANALEAPCLDLEELAGMDGADLLFLVSGGVSSGENKSGIEGVVKKLDGGKIKNVALVTLDSNWDNTSVAGVYNISGSQALLRKILEEKDVPVLDEHMCETQFKFFAIGHPNKKDVRKTVEWAQKLIGSF